VRLRGEVHDGRRPVLHEQAVHQLPVPDPPPHENVVRILRNRRERLRITRISKGVQVNDLEFARGHRLQDEISPDKAGAAGDEDRGFLSLQSAPLSQGFRPQVSGFRKALMPDA
jgi:hypothetical protein